MPEIDLEARSDVSFKLETKPRSPEARSELRNYPHLDSTAGPHRCVGKNKHNSHAGGRSAAPRERMAKPGVCVNLLSVQVMSNAGQVAALSRLARGV